MSQSRVTPISGFPEFLPGDRIVEQHFLDVIRDTFELHGFASVETRAKRRYGPAPAPKNSSARSVTSCGFSSAMKWPLSGTSSSVKSSTYGL